MSAGCVHDHADTDQTRWSILDEKYGLPDMVDGGLRAMLKARVAACMEKKRLRDALEQLENVGLTITVSSDGEATTES